MNIENRLEIIAKFKFRSPDANEFIAKLHSELEHRHKRKTSFRNGVISACLVILLSFISFSQLTDNQNVYLSTDLYPIEIMNFETEAYIYDLAEYLVGTSDDIWETMAFLNDIQFEPVVAMNSGGKP